MKSHALLWEALRMASSGLRSDKLRTLLSLSGVVIGIFTIISVLAAVDSLQKDIRRSLENLGSRVLFVSKWPWSGMNAEYPWWKYLSRPSPTWQEADEIRRRLPLAENVVFRIETTAPVEYQGHELNNVSLEGITPDYTKVWEVNLAEGRFLSETEFHLGSPVAVLGHTVAKELLGNQKAEGRIIRIRNRPVRVVGVLAREGRSLLGGFTDECVFVPLLFFRTIYSLSDPDLYSEVIVKPKGRIPLGMVREELTGVMRALRRLRPFDEENFSINQTDMLVREVSGIFTVLHAVALILGGISIFIGGFGVANIMFVSVKERTVQIGIQKALGATPAFILWQFLLEAVILALVGCAVGLVLVWVATHIASAFLNFRMTLSGLNIVIGMVISALTGLFAGLAPARAAARLSPVEAMRGY
ncbi:MAG: ABC transporter permease [Flavobacteriales bacterium]|nr:ABC transporter permease [Flavobacteriales bacterium]